MSSTRVGMSGGVRDSTRLVLVLLCFSWAATGVTGQQLIPVPATMTHDLNAYYLSRLGRDIKFYNVLTGRNVFNTNAYNIINGLPDDIHPKAAAALMSPIRGFYVSNGLGGRVVVDVYYKLFRCPSPTDCTAMERVVIADTVAGPRDQLFVLKAEIGNTGWLINAANQSAANAVLNQGGVIERLYTDQTYKSALFYKVVPPSSPCSSATPQTAWGPSGEFEGVTRFACVQYQGVYILLTTDNRGGIDAMRAYGVNSSLCDGSVAVLDVTDATNQRGQDIVALVRRPNAVPLTLWMVLPYNLGCTLMATTEMTLKAAVSVAADAANSTATAPTGFLTIPKGVLNLGFKSTGSCAPNYFPMYGAFPAGQVNIKDQFPGNQTFAAYILSSDNGRVCMAALANYEIKARDQTEDECAELFLGDAARVKEGAITFNDLNTTGPATPVHVGKLTEYCNTYYKIGVRNILSQIPLDFEADRALLVSSSDIKIHLDAVAANAASVVALEIALVSAGVVISHIIARSSFYRRQHISSGVARVLACALTATAITAFNVPNFGLVYKSLENRNKERVYTSVGTHLYQTGNDTGFLAAETHAFVSVRGSAASAIIGLLLYSLTLLVAVYITWEEFTEIIKRKGEASRRLGHEALLEDKHLLVEWRGTDSRLMDLLHPTAVKEAGWEAEMELRRRAVARKQLETGGSFDGNSQLLSLQSAFRYQGLDSPRETYRGGTPAL